MVNIINYFLMRVILERAWGDIKLKGKKRGDHL